MADGRHIENRLFVFKHLGLRSGGVFSDPPVRQSLLSLLVNFVLKIGQYLAKLWARVMVFCFFDSRSVCMFLCLSVTMRGQRGQILNKCCVAIYGSILTLF